MRLSEDEYYLFIEIYHALILFAGKKYKVVKENLSLEAFRPLGTVVKFPCWDKLYMMACYKVILSFLAVAIAVL